jgi:hypothetical protein
MKKDYWRYVNESHRKQNNHMESDQSITIMFHEIATEHCPPYAITISPKGTKFHTQSWEEWANFSPEDYTLLGLYTSSKPLTVSIMDEKGDVWVCTTEGVFPERRCAMMLTKIAETLQSQDALIECTYDGQTVALLKDKKIVLGCKYVYESLQEMKVIKMIHHHNVRFIARLAVSSFPESLWPEHLLKETDAINRIYKELCK